jgi:uncharacterized protein
MERMPVLIAKGARFRHVFPMLYCRAISLGLLLFLAGCGESVSSPKTTPPPAPPTPVAEPKQKALPKQPTLKLRMGTNEISAEILIRDADRQMGMMFRDSLGESEGMLFVFEAPHQAGFWMKNTKVPLTAAYIDPDGVIVELHDLEPHNTNTVLAQSDRIQYVLEMNRDWFKRNGIGPGVLISTERGTFKQVFFGKK